MTITATYEDKNTKDVTDQATFSGYNMSATGTQTVTVSYTEGEITKTATYDITVSAPATLASITLSGDYQTVFSEGDTFNHDGLVVTAHYSDETTQDVTDLAEFSTPDMNETGTQTITVTYNDISTTYDITVNAIPTHNVTWSVNGATTVQPYKEGATINFPDTPADISDKTFVGWATDAITGTTDEAPEFVTSATMGNADITYYAVFASATEGEAKDSLVQTLQYDTWTYEGGTTTDKNSYRLFGDGAYVKSAAFNLSKLSKVKIFGGTFGGQTTYNTVTIGDGTNVWKEVEMTGTGNTKEHSFTEGNSLSGTKPLRVISTCGDGKNNGIRMSKIEIYLSFPTISYSDYCTSVVADTRKDPELSFAVTEANASIGGEFTPPTLLTAEGFNGTVEYESSNDAVAEVWDMETGELRLMGEGTAVITVTFAGNDDFKAGSASYTLTVTDNRIATTTSQDPIVLDVTEVGTLTRLAPIVKDAEDNVIAYSYDEWPTEMSFEIVSDVNSLIASLDNNTGEIILNGVEGTATLKAYYNFYNVNNTYKPSECTFIISVENRYAPGKKLNPYTVAQAREAIDAGTGVTGVYAKGIVSEIVTKYSSTYHNITYNISADGTTEVDQLQAYRGKSFGGENFNSADEIKVGDEVIIYGNLTKYNSTYEFNSNNQLVSRKRITISEAQYATYASEYARDFSGSGLTVYTAKYNSDRGTATLNKVEDGKVPANTAVILYAETAGDYIASVIASAEALENNDLQVSDGTVTGGAEIYCLAKKNENVGFYNVAPEVTVPAGKAYLVAVGANAREFISFLEDETTGISLLENKKQMENCYNLNGQRVAAPAKGLYIVNGKKIVIK